MEEEVQTMWSGTSAPSVPTREPKLPSKNDEVRSNLRADAPEFVPTWLQATTQQFENLQINHGEKQQRGVQNRLNKHRNEPEQRPQTSQDSSDMVRLEQIITSLINYPGQFDNLLAVFMETIHPYFNEENAMKEITHLIVSQAIGCNNFCYNGVRLCLCIEQNCSSFRDELHQCCERELRDNPNQQNVLMFIAELFTQLSYDTFYGNLLTEAMKNLLRNGDDNIKCVCQALKLTGYALEVAHKPALNEVFQQLKEFTTTTLSCSLLSFVNSVINLRESNWGRSSNEITSSNPDDLSVEYEPDYEEMVNGITYETEGNQLTNEEQEFLAANAYYPEEDLDDLDDPQMDDEIQEAYEEFLKMSSKTR